MSAASGAACRVRLAGTGRLARVAGRRGRSGGAANGRCVSAAGRARRLRAAGRLRGCAAGRRGALGRRRGGVRHDLGLGRGPCRLLRVRWLLLGRWVRFSRRRRWSWRGPSGGRGSVLGTRDGVTARHRRALVYQCAADTSAERGDNDPASDREPLSAPFDRSGSHTRARAPTTSRMFLGRCFIRDRRLAAHGWRGF